MGRADEGGNNPVGMKSKPEWMRMYAELLEMHRHYEVDDDKPYRVFLDWDIEPDNPLHWCLEHLPMDSWSCRFVDNPEISGGFFSFDRQEHLVLFNLVWC